MIALLDNTVLSNFTIIARPMLVWMALGEEAATVEEPFAGAGFADLGGTAKVQRFHRLHLPEVYHG